MPLSPPEPLAERHEFDSFASGEAALDDWHRRRARANQVNGASRTYVICEGKRVAGYHALATGAIFSGRADPPVRGRPPGRPSPVVLLARLAVDRTPKDTALAAPCSAMRPSASRKRPIPSAFVGSWSTRSPRMREDSTSPSGSNPALPKPRPWLPLCTIFAPRSAKFRREFSPAAPLTTEGDHPRRCSCARPKNSPMVSSAQFLQKTSEPAADSQSCTRIRTTTHHPLAMIYQSCAL